MNTLDIYTREKTNKLYLEEMQREAQSRRLSSLTNQEAENVSARRANPSVFVMKLTRWFWPRPSQNIDGAREPWVCLDLTPNPSPFKRGKAVC